MTHRQILASSTNTILAQFYDFRKKILPADAHFLLKLAEKTRFFKKFKPKPSIPLLYDMPCYLRLKYDRRLP